LRGFAQRRRCLRAFGDEARGAAELALGTWDKPDRYRRWDPRKAEPRLGLPMGAPRTVSRAIEPFQEVKHIFLQIEN
jgi:hypothetical protein